MKSTGIVRRIDPLGRVVLPHELRKSLVIKNRDPLEIFVDGEQIILKKYSPHKACIITGEVSEDNMVFGNGKVVLSREGLYILSQELEKRGVNL
ncbi:AbrB family transcriptional regulator (plasmid) [Priestia filamentosa]|uniref:AbrB family transcriptional regulator n=1 Tax=Priestia filamentosa TaxID=1402861 RepID=A0A2L1FFY0_9BACI|nr:AbrB/MazE/SpoVT family DNA-binding domain-containing protein [Priestia filamentosa]AVD54657.1 AbrB/MazE/SpoVT family DNA-binding domain-containing protein [Priestia filamentosa]AWG44854.1 AbrB family transcriptional regulator [Priestia filamentosa]